MMKHRHLAIAAMTLAAIAGSSALTAASLSPEQALVRATSGRNSAMRAPGSASQYALAATIATPEAATPALYAMNRADGQGFVIVAADDRFPALFGYSDSGSFDPEQAPEALRWLLESYAAQIEAYGDSKPLPSRQSAAGHRAIEPLLLSEWAQSYPYNAMCPTVWGSRCKTGCIATAMAQVMRYFSYPDKGIGTHTYTDSYGEEYTFDFGATTFDWTAMPARIRSTSPAEQIDAVATLIYACGVSANMSFDTEISLAQNYAPVRGMIENFGYTKGVQFHAMPYYSLPEWTEMVYNELAESRPVILAGQKGSNGHAFICDGTDGNDYYHINWGFGGDANGYYLLTDLEPKVYGDGTVDDDDYSLNMRMVANMRPEPGGQTFYPLYGNSGMGIKTGNVTLTGSKAGIYNYSPYELKADLGCIAVDDNGNRFATATYSGQTFKGIGQGSNGKGAWKVEPKNLANGHYRVYYGYKPEGQDWQIVRCPAGEPQYVDLTVSGSNYTYSASDPNAVTEIYVSHAYPKSQFEPGARCEWHIEVENLGIFDYEGALNMAITAPGSNQVIRSITLGKISVDADDDRSFKATLDLGITSAGGYDAYFTDQLDQRCSPRYPFYVGIPDIPVGELYLTQRQIQLNPGETYQLEANMNPVNATFPTLFWYSEDPEVATVSESGLVTAVGHGDATIRVRTCDGSNRGDECEVTVAAIPAEGVMLNHTLVEGEPGFETRLVATVFPSTASSKEVRWKSSNGAVATVSADGVVIIHSAGESTITATTTEYPYASAECLVRGLSGIDEVMADADSRADIFTPEGILVDRSMSRDDLQRLPSGVYIVRSAKGATKIVR